MHECGKKQKSFARAMVDFTNVQLGIWKYLIGDTSNMDREKNGILAEAAANEMTRLQRIRGLLVPKL